MRLCLRDFRHDRILGLIQPALGMRQLARDLARLHMQENLSERDIHQEFLKLVRSVNEPQNARGAQEKRTLKGVLSNHLRSQYQVRLVGESLSLYGPRSSILNRLIVSQLEMLDAFKYVPDKIIDPVGYSSKRKFLVRFVGRDKPEQFDLFVDRRGPKPCLPEFETIFKQCDKLKAAWETVTPSTDLTREPLWKPGQYGETGSRAIEGTSAHKLSIWKEVQSDGSCTVYYTFEGLSVASGYLESISFSFHSEAGLVSSPVIDNDGQRLGVRWAGNPERRPGHISGGFRFKSPLKAGDQPVTFGFSFEVLNGHARTHWEHAQIYGPDTHRDISGGRLNNVESFVRTIWFSVMNLEIKLSLPPTISADPTIAFFEAAPDPRRSEGITRQRKLKLDRTARWSRVSRAESGLRLT